MPILSDSTYECGPGEFIYEDENAEIFVTVANGDRINLGKVGDNVDSAVFADGLYSNASSGEYMFADEVTAFVHDGVLQTVFVDEYQATANALQTRD